MQRLEIGPPELGVLAHTMRKVEFFAPLTMGQVEKILPSIMLFSYAPGETVFKKGQKGDAFYIVYKGSVDISIPRVIFLSKKVASLKAGDFFGEIALISDEPRTATVAAAEASLLFTLIAEDFKFVLAENPAAAEEMRRIASRRKFATSKQADS